ncbi:UNVERIFIED_CONTAM: hypothetical protein RMT77_003883 [Armadillidium vulgare]
MQSLESGLSTKGQRIFNFMKNCSFDRIKLLMKKFENLEANKDCTLDEKPSVIVNLLEAHFKEGGVLFRIVEETTQWNEISSDMLPKTPCLIVCGNSINLCDRFMLAVDQQVQIDFIEDFLSGFAVLFAAFYVFNIEYPEESKSVLEFIQRSCTKMLLPSKFLFAVWCNNYQILIFSALK